MGDAVRICIVHPPAYVGVNPTLHSAVSFLVERGHEVHMIGLEAPAGAPRGLHAHALRAARPWLRRRWLRPLALLWMPLYVWRTVRAVGGTLVVAVDTEGSVASALTLLDGRVPHVYLSLHITFLREQWRRRSPGGVVRRLLERLLLRRMDAILTQDLHRRDRLLAENRLAAGGTRVFLLPNSYRGSASPEPSTYYQDRFGLDAAAPVVLVAGAVAPRSHLGFLAECAGRQTVPPRYTLVVQSREPLPPHLREFAAPLAGEHVALSLDPVPIEDLSRAFASAAAGVALYTSDWHENQALVGGSSGRMMAYLKAGVPVIMLASPGVSEVVKAYRCGRLLQALDVDEFNEAVGDVIANRSEYSANAARCYDELYEFDRNFAPVYELMLELA